MQVSVRSLCPKLKSPRPIKRSLHASPRPSRQPSLARFSISWADHVVAAGSRQRCHTKNAIRRHAATGSSATVWYGTFSKPRVATAMSRPWWRPRCPCIWPRSPGPGSHRRNSGQVRCSGTGTTSKTPPRWCSRQRSSARRRFVAREASHWSARTRRPGRRRRPGHCRARNDMAATQRRYRRQRQR
jgi:hypothetical protein